MLDILDLLILLFTHMFFFFTKYPFFQKLWQQPTRRGLTGMSRPLASTSGQPSLQNNVFPFVFFLKSKQNSSLDGQDWDTTSYELQQGAGEASDWQDRESEKLKPPGSKHLAGVFVTKGGWGFLKNGFFFSQEQVFFTFGRNVFFFQLHLCVRLLGLYKRNTRHDSPIISNSTRRGSHA